MNWIYRSSLGLAAVLVLCVPWIAPCNAWPAEQTQEEPLVFCSTKRALSQASNEREVMSALISLIEVEMPSVVGFPMKMQFANTDEEMYQAVARKQADIGCGHLTKFLAQYKRGLVKPVVWFYQEGWNGDRYCLAMRPDAPYTQAKQLRGQGLVLAYTELTDLPKIKYSFFRHNPKDDVHAIFPKMRQYSNVKDALYALKQRRVDVVFESQYSVETTLDLKSVKGEFKMILSDEVLADLPLFVRTGLEPEKRAKMEKVIPYFFKMHETPRTKFLLHILGCDELREVGEEQEKRYQEWIKKFTAMGLM